MSDDIIDIILNQQLQNDKAKLLISKTANRWMEEAANQPIPKMLCNNLWHQGELCFLFADTNLGKSILAVQIADAISRGESEHVFRVEAEKQKVLYFDFELSVKQFQNRYSDNYRNPYEFDDNFIRIEIDPEGGDVFDFEKSLFEAINDAVTQHNAKILVVDNMTYLKTQSTDTAREALPLMNMLIQLKRKHGLSILALAHTPKRNQANPITINDLAGSKHIANFADSVFAIGSSSKGNNLRYIKHIKARATEKIFDSDYVIVCSIDKRSNFLCFNHEGYEHENEHLRQPTERENSELDEQIIEMYKEQPDLTLREIARKLDISNHKKVLRVLDRNGLRD